MIFAAFSTFLIVSKITNPVLELSKKMEQYSMTKTHERISLKGCYEVEVAGNAYNKMIDEIEQYIDKLTAENEARRQAELKSLRMQINPHFLYNTLASVKYLTLYGKKQQAAESITALISLLQKTFGDSREIITLGEELLLVDYYMTIQKHRYGNNLRLTTFVPEDLLKCTVPKLILQPLIENCIFHAFGDNITNGVISIFARLEGNDVIIDVIDNGKGIPGNVIKLNLEEIPSTTKNSHSGIGIKNIDNRIKLIYGQNYGLSVVSNEGIGTQVTLRIPCSNAG